MPGKARPGHGVSARWRAWFRRPADGSASDELEDSTAPEQRDPEDSERPRPASLDDVLRDAAQRREAGHDRDRGGGEPVGN